jgi:hypothetical protein
MRKVAIAVACAVALLLLLFQALSVLGPLWAPDFRAMEWETMRVSYWVRYAGHDNFRENRREFTITEKAVLRRLQDLLSIRDVQRLSIGASTQLVILMADGHTWQGDVVFEDQFYLCRQDDTWRSYALTLRSTGLYDQLVRLCLEHERGTHPRATASQIILRSNLDAASYDPIDEGSPSSATPANGDDSTLDPRR